jgi:hypothetical protein
VFFLALGFLLQALGYIFITAISTTKATGAREAVGVGASVVLAFLITTAGARIWRRIRRTSLIVEVSRYDQNPRVRLPLPLAWRLDPFAEAVSGEDMPTWFGAHRQEVADHLIKAQLLRYRSMFGVEDFYDGRDPYWKGTEARTAEQIPPPGVPMYDSAEIGERVEGAGGVLRRIFGGT